MLQKGLSKCVLITSEQQSIPQYYIKKQLIETYQCKSVIHRVVVYSFLLIIGNGHYEMNKTLCLIELIKLMYFPTYTPGVLARCSNFVICRALLIT